MNNGIKTEKNIVNTLNNKRITELNVFYSGFIREMFGNVDENEIIKASLFTRTAKPDLYVSYKNEMRFVSVKTGKTDSLHLERVKDFVLFLRELGISKETQKTILLFHYGDGTMTGDGKYRKTYEELIVEMKDKIELANNELNKPRIIEKVYNRAAIKGNEYRANEVDYFLYGDNEFGIYVSKNQMLDFILSKRHYSFHTLHIGPMIIQPYLRDVYRKSKNTFKRDFIQIKWHYFFSDMERAKGLYIENK